MVKLSFVFLVFCCFTNAFAQRHNPRYDEWLRKKSIVDSIAKIQLDMNDKSINSIKYFDLFGGVGVSSLAATGRFSVQEGGSARGKIYTEGVGPSLFLGLGNLYSPTLFVNKFEVVYGFSCSFSSNYGSVSIDQYSHGKNGLIGSSDPLDYKDISTRKFDKTLARNTVLAAVIHLGTKINVGKGVTLGFNGGVGLMRSTINVEFNFVKLLPNQNNSVVNLYGEVHSTGLCGYAGVHVNYLDHWFITANVDGGLLANSGGVSAETLFGSRIYVGARLPLFRSDR